MAQKLTLRYDEVGDILYIDQVAPYPEQESEDIGDEIIARLNPNTKKIENLEVLFFSTRLHGVAHLELPVEADLQLSR